MLKLLTGAGGRVRRGGTRTAFGLAAALLLTACAHTSEPVIRTVEVRVPVAVRCGSDPGPDPAFSDTPEALRGAADIWERVKLLLAGRAQRDARLIELKAASAGCR